MATASTVSLRKLEANRLNAQKSTGPRTPEGKARSAANATVIHGFYSSKLLLDGEDPRELEELRHEMFRDLRPAGSAEQLIVERLVAAHWKLRRLHGAEQRMLDHKLASLRQHAKPADATPDAALVEMVCDGAELDRLSICERRLEGSIHRCHRELRLLRKDREQRHEEIEPEPQPNSEPAEVEPPRDVENVRSEPTAGWVNQPEANVQHGTSNAQRPTGGDNPRLSTKTNHD